MKEVSNSVKQTQDLAKKIARSLKPAKHAVVIALSGDLGAGKTVFVQGLAKAMGIRSKITSPTFVIEKIYKLKPRSKFSHLVHIDAYRINGSKEIKDLGWKDLVNDPKNMILIEWAEKIRKILPKSKIAVHIRHISEKRRDIDISLNN